MEVKPNANQLFTNIIDICGKTRFSDLPYGFALAFSVAGSELQPLIITAHRQMHWTGDKCLLSDMNGRAKVNI